MPNPARFPACASLLALALLAPLSHAQTPYAPSQVTASDYARAESMLAHKLDPLAQLRLETMDYTWITNELVAMVGTLFYFGFFLLMAWWSQLGTPKPVPDRVTFKPH